MNKYYVTLSLSLSDLVLVDLLLQDLIGIRVHLHLFLFLQFPPQPGQVLLEDIRIASGVKQTAHVTTCHKNPKCNIPGLVSGCCSPSLGQSGSQPQRPGSP